MGKLVIGCGYLGRRVAQRWVDRGDTVHATTRSEPRGNEWRAAGIEPVVCDILRPETLAQLPRAETVLYAVGLDRTAGVSMRQLYVDGLRHVLDHLPRPERFLYVSSTSVYGQTGGEVVDETAATEPLDEAGRVVLDAERLLQGRMPHAILLRFAGIYGPGRLMRQSAITAGQPIATDPDKWLNLIHVEDGVTAVLAAEAHGRAGAVYNVCDGQPVRRGDFYRFMAQALGAPAPRFVAPPEEESRSGRDRANRSIRNRQMLEELRVQLKYPSYRAGLTALAASGESV